MRSAFVVADWTENDAGKEFYTRHDSMRPCLVVINPMFCIPRNLTVRGNVAYWVCSSCQCRGQGLWFGANLLQERSRSLR